MIDMLKESGSYLEKFLLNKIDYLSGNNSVTKEDIFNNINIWDAGYLLALDQTILTIDEIQMLEKRSQYPRWEDYICRKHKAFRYAIHVVKIKNFVLKLRKEFLSESFDDLSEFEMCIFDDGSRAAFIEILKAIKDQTQIDAEIEKQMLIIEKTQDEIRDIINSFEYEDADYTSGYIQALYFSLILLEDWKEEKLARDYIINKGE